jgi:FkbM family methyltransferase
LEGVRDISYLVNILEKAFKVHISRSPLDKYYNNFIDLIHQNLISQCSGILHIGAHVGQEAAAYFKQEKPAIFVEPDPNTYEILTKNIKPFNKNQKSYMWLLGDEEHEVPFHVASNEGQSSSIFQFNSEHSFRDVQTSNIITKQMTRLDLKFTQSELQEYDYWVIDVQGAELQVLKGAGDLIKGCKFLFVETSTEEFYQGGTLWPALKEFLEKSGFIYLVTPRNSKHLNVLFIRY